MKATNDLVAALRSHLASGQALSREQSESWRKAIDALDGARLPMRIRLENFANALGLKAPKRGRPAKRYSQIAKCADAVVRVRKLQAAGSSREDALLQVSRDVFQSEDKVSTLAKWCTDKRIIDMIAYFEENPPGFLPTAIEMTKRK